MLLAGCKERPSVGPPSEGPADAATASSGSPAAALTILYPPDGCVLDSPTLQLVVVADDPRAVPAIAVDGQQLELSRLLVAGDWPQASRPAADITSSPGQQVSRAGCRAEVRPGQVLLHAAVGLTEGEHTIIAGTSRARVFVRSATPAAGTADRPVFHLHPPPIGPGRTVACSKCHSIDGDAFGPAATPDSCFTCHEKGAFSVTHMHRIESLTACAMCHDPHGSLAEKALLKADPAVLCATCHE